jgi:hypothetical protein
MASVIRIKRSEVNGNPASLCAGELAYSGTGAGTSSNGEDRLYIGLGTETAGNAANHIVIGGKYFTDMLDHTQGTLTANAALITDGDSKLNNLKVDNLDLNGNTISSLDTNGNIVLDPNGTGYVTITGTNALILPVGTTAQRGPTVQGGIRYNSTTSSFEGYDGANWGSLGGVKDVDQDTFIIAETSAGNDDDTLTFSNAGATTLTLTGSLFDLKSDVQMAVNNTTQSTSATTGALVVDGGVGIAKNVHIGGDLDVEGTMNFTGGAEFQGSVTIAGSETPATEFFTIHDGSSSETVAFQVDSANGNTTVAGTLGVTGEATLASATVSDLTAGRVVYAGTSGSLVDSANLTFNGTTLSINGVSVTNNVSVGGTVGITGEATLASATISDLTNNRLVIAGTSGSLEDSANLTFDGSTFAVTGTVDITGSADVSSDFSVATNKFTVASASGNTAVAGTLGVTGATTLSSTLGVTGNLSVNTNKFTVAADTGNTAIAGTLAVTGATGIDGDFDIATNKFTVASASGNTVIAGSLTTSGALDLGTTSSTVDIEASTLAIDSTDTTNITMTANSASNKVFAIDATNAGSGEAVLNVGSTSTDLVKIDSATKTTIESDTEVEVNAAIVDINASGDIDLTTTGGDITFQAGGTIINSDQLTLQGEGGAGNDLALSIEGSLTVDNVKIDGNTISNLSDTTLYIDPYPVADNGGTVVIKGNLQVDGTTTTINSNVVTIDDPIFVLGGDTAAASDDNLDRGILFRWHDGSSDGAKDGFFGYDESAGEFVFIEDATDTSSVITGTLGDVAFGNGRFAATTSSTSSTTGAVKIAGGLGVAENINAAGYIKTTATTQSTSTTTGSIITAGGMGVAKTIYVGDDIIGAGFGTSTLDGFNIDGGTY